MTDATLSRPVFSVDFMSRFLLAIALVLLAWISAWPIMSPSVVPATAPRASFSAERAMADLRVVASEPHGAGTDAQFGVRDYILGEAAAAGLTGRVQQSGAIENVIVRLPGTASTGDVIISGHYDSHSPAPGAGDDGISVAAMLETIRTLRAGPQFRNDLVFVFADGEESGWVGSQAFVKEYPATEQNHLALVFDARPGNGPVMLKETSVGDDWLIGQIAAARPPLSTGSWLNADERQDSDTDFTSTFLPARYMGVEIENEARGTAYHTTTDTVDAISPGIVQAQGESMVRLARQFGNLDLGAARPGQDVTYFTLPAFLILVYPAWVTPAAAVLALLVLLVVTSVEWRRKDLSIVRSLASAVALLVAVVVLALLSALVWDRLLATQPVTREMTLGYLDFPTSGAWIAGIMAMALLLFISVLYGLSRRIDAISLSVGGILVYLLLTTAVFLAMDSDNPLTAPFYAWPLVGGVAGLVILVMVHRPGWTALLLLLTAVPVLVLTTPRLVPAALRPQESAWIPVLYACVMLAMLIPQLGFIAGRRWWPSMRSKTNVSHAGSVQAAGT